MVTDSDSEHKRRRSRRGATNIHHSAGQIYHGVVNAGLVMILALAVATTSWGTPFLRYGVTLLIWTLAAIWGVRLMMKRDTTLIVSPIGVPVAIFGLYLAVRFIVACPEGYIAGRPQFWMTFSCVAMFFIVMNALRERWQFQAVIWILFILGSLAALLAVIDFAGVQDLPRRLVRIGQPPLEVVESAFRPNHLAALMELTVMILLAGAFLTRLDSGIKILFISSAILMMQAIIFSSARASWLAVGFGLFVLLAMLVRQGAVRPKWVPMILIGLVLVGGIGLASAPKLRGQLGQLFRTGDPVRWSLWESAFQMGISNPLIGVGPGMFPQLYPAFREDAGAGMPECTMSDWLQLFAEHGTVGVVIILWVLGTLAVASMRLVKRWKNQNLLWYHGESAGRGTRHALMVGMMAAIASITLHSALDSVLHATGVAVFLILIVATAMAGSRRWGREKGKITGFEEADEPQGFPSVELKSPVVRIVGGLFLLISLLFLVWMGRGFVGATLTHLGDKRQMDGAQMEAVVAVYERAWAWDKGDITPALRIGSLMLNEAKRLETAKDQNFKTAARTAIFWFRMVTTHQPLIAENYIRLAAVKQLLDQRVEAETALHRAIELEPRNANFRVILAEHYLRYNQKDEAIRQLEVAITLEGKSGAAAMKLKELSPPENNAPPAPVGAATE